MEYTDRIMEYLNTVAADLGVMLDPVIGVDPLWVVALFLLLIWLRLGSVKRYARASARSLERNAGFLMGGDEG